jgi:hypothetical protein
MEHFTLEVSKCLKQKRSLIVEIGLNCFHKTLNIIWVGALYHMGIQNRKPMGKNLRNVDMECAQLLNYCTTLVGLTLIILFVEMLNISQIFFSKNKIMYIYIYINDKISKKKIQRENFLEGKVKEILNFLEIFCFLNGVFKIN